MIGPLLCHVTVIVPYCASPASLWATDHYQPLRIFSGHLADVTCTCFHPNSNYVATGSSDRTIRLWDVLTGNCVRIFTGHKVRHKYYRLADLLQRQLLTRTYILYLPQGPIHALDFSPSGKFLASGATDGRVLLWDIGHGLMVGELKGHTDTIYTLKFSRDGEILASGMWPIIQLLNWTASNGIANKSHQISSVSDSDNLSPFFFFLGSMDNTVHLWDAVKAFDDLETDDFTAATGHIHLQDNSQELLLGTYMSKSTPVVHLHFTRRNLLLAAGAYNPWHFTGLQMKNFWSSKSTNSKRLMVALNIIISA